MLQKISIVIPIFNRAKVISETLNSVLTQTYHNWECIIVDDGSVDNTVEIVKNYIDKDNRFRFYKRTADKLKGPASCRNIGIEKALGDYVIFLDSDDILDKNCLENRIKYVKQYPNYDIWVFKMSFLDGKTIGKICNLYPKNKEDKNEYLKMFLRYEVPFSVTCPLWKTDILKRIRGFDKQFNRLEDPDIHCRALAQDIKFKFNYTDTSDCFYRVGPNDLKRIQDLEFKEIFINSFYLFLEKYSNFETNSIGNDEIKKQLNILLLRVFKEYILMDNYYFKSFTIFYQLGKKYKILNLKELILILILKEYKKIKLDKVAGFGFFKIRKIIFKKLKH